MIFRWVFLISQSFSVSKKIQEFMKNRLEIYMRMIFRDHSLGKSQQQFFIQRLQFSETNHEISTLRRWKLLLVVLRCRGLLRTLLFLNPLTGDDIPTNLHALKRTDIFRTIITNRVEFSSQIIARLKIVHPSPTDIQRSTEINEIARFNLNKLQANLGKKEFYFEIHSKKDVVFGSDSVITISKPELCIYRLMHKDSMKIRDLIHERNIVELSRQYFEQIYPQFLLSVSDLVSLNILTLPKYDDVLEFESNDNLHSEHQLLHNVQIWHQRFIVSRNDLVIIDSTTHPEQEFVAGQWQFLNTFHKDVNTCFIKISRGETCHLESAIFLIGRCDENWYHFIVDTVPRILFTDKIPGNAPLIIRADIPENFKRIVSILSTRDIIEIEIDDKIEIDNLYVVPGRSSAFDSQPLNGSPFVEFSSSALKRTQELLLSSMVEPNSSQNLLKSNKRIALSRNSLTRNVQNWVSLIPLIKSFDFSVQDLNSDFFRTQIATFYHSGVILAPGGAALANIIFMQKGSYVVVLRSWRNRDVSLWTKLADAMGVNCVEVPGIPTYFGPGKLRRRHSDFYVSPRKLRKVLTSVTASITRYASESDIH
jgi:hypothetical protein